MLKIVYPTIHYHNDEWKYRPKNFAVDVFVDGTWKRVVEQHLSEYTESEFTYSFAAVSATKVRVTASNKGLTVGNYRLAEIETYYDKLLVEEEYSPLVPAPDAASTVPVPTPEDEPDEVAPTGYAFPLVALPLAGASAAVAVFAWKSRKKTRV